MSKKLDEDVVESLDHSAIFQYCVAAGADHTLLADALQRIVKASHESLENDAPRKIKYEALALSCVAACVALENGVNAQQLSTGTCANAIEIAAKLGTMKERAKEAKINAKVLKKLQRCSELLFVAIWQRLTADERALLAKRESVQELRRESIELRWKHRALQHAACVLDAEPLLVLCPAQNWGARVTIRGLSDNAQLMWLLVAQLHAALPPAKVDWEKPPADILAVYAGEKHTDIAVGQVDGIWNMYNWFALDSTGQLRGNYQGLPNTGAWVWCEGTPSDIDVCDRLPGEAPVRVVLIGPVPYKRRIPIQRDFPSMKASVEVREILSDADVKKFTDALTDVDERIKQSSSRRVRLETNVGREEVEQNEVQLVPAHMLFGPAA